MGVAISIVASAVPILLRPNAWFAATNARHWRGGNQASYRDGYTAL